MNRDKLVEKMLKAKGDVNNTIDLNAYGNGLIDMFNELQKAVKNINYDTVLEAVNCKVCGTKLSEQEKEGGNCCDACWLRN